MIRIHTNITPTLAGFLKDMNSNRQTVISLNGASLSALPDLQTPVIWHQENNTTTAAAAAQLIYGGIAATGRLTAAEGHFAKGAGINTKKQDWVTAHPKRLD
ncbi:hypothetical protein MKQ70_19775 [Chitinophaga sedimenti]|uniref:hypothetical protein n=1 Tax=Chitinophaga sedimenti TaxID=2033606 RepID=UPI00200655D9|nr:hypothetical protein [Chitinophaga sedimenti]MCK7557121.1 hypothetical protein [Chitinophaga sedimenti]